MMGPGKRTVYLFLAALLVSDVAMGAFFQQVRPSVLALDLLAGGHHVLHCGVIVCRSTCIERPHLMTLFFTDVYGDAVVIWQLQRPVYLSSCLQGRETIRRSSCYVPVARSIYVCRQNQVRSTRRKLLHPM